MPKKKFGMALVGEDGNAFAIMGRFKSEAKRNGWTPEEIKEVLDECQSGDYDHLLQTIMEYTTNNDEEEAK